MHLRQCRHFKFFSTHAHTKKILRIQEYYSKLFKVPEVIPQLSFPGTYLVYIIINCTSKIIPTLLVIITCTK